MSQIKNQRFIKQGFIGRLTRTAKQKGVAAVEFALALPILVTLLLGGADAAYMMLLSQRVDRISYTVTDLVTQSKTISISDLDRILLAAGQLMQPFDFGPKGIVIITSLYKPTGKSTTISWQYQGGGSLSRNSAVGNLGSSPAIPGGLILNDNENVIVAEVFYDFDPMFLNVGIFAKDDIYRVSIYKPRLSPLVTPPI